ncbi:hypothetical protein H131_08663 [Lysinibacillus sphaericus OT4b.31]|uniref:Uncharacterized protein n=1 Tax=Lysinibacillus sphaericus OT4b.31 TaxID=1285586 RepID=R7ZG50_LYSSH|nr:hypothetical protein H131_08663 [Lysinibacillus sphaericus OT4b.31]
MRWVVGFNARVQGSAAQRRYQAFPLGYKGVQRSAGIRRYHSGTRENCSAKGHRGLGTNIYYAMPTVITNEWRDTK